MSEDPEVQNFSDVNLNAIKNTKLFQKFMQNKSGLVANTGKQTEIKTVQRKQKFEGQHKKWNNKSHEQPSKKQTVHKETNKQFRPQSIAQSINQNYDGLTENHTQVSYHNYQSDQQQNPNFKNKQTFVDQDVEHSYLEPYSRGLRNEKAQDQQRNNFYQLQQRMITVTKADQQEQNARKSNNSHAPRRKRDFNPYSIQAKRNNDPEQQPERSFHAAKNNISEDYSNNTTKHSYINQNIPSFNTVGIFHPPPSVSPHKYRPALNPPSLTTIHPTIHPESHHTYASQSVSLTQAQYKQKYETLLKKHEQLKHEYKNENKTRRKQLNEWEHQIEVIKQKLFDVQSREDTLLIENQRLKQKYEGQNLQKMKTHQESKQLGYKIKQLEDQILLKDNALKQKNDEINYWKGQADSIKHQFNAIRLSFQKKSDEYNLLYGDYQIVKKQTHNKDYLLEDLRRNISDLVQQNSAAKDQLFSLVTKLYQLQQQNQILRNDLKRQHLDTSQMSYMRDRIQSTHIQRQERQEQHQRNDRNSDKQEFIKEPVRHSLTQHQKPRVDQKPIVAQKPTRRRGQFARQRGQFTRNQRPERDQKPQIRQISHHNMIQVQQAPQKNVSKPNYGNNRSTRIQQVSQQLQKIKDMKAMNGAIRRRKIDLQRQLQELEGQ